MPVWISIPVQSLLSYLYNYVSFIIIIWFSYDRVSVPVSAFITFFIVKRVFPCSVVTLSSLCEIAFCLSPSDHGGFTGIFQECPDMTLLSSTLGSPCCCCIWGKGALGRTVQQ